MEHSLYEQIHRSGVIRGKKLSLPRIRRLSVSDIIDFAHRSLEATSAEQLPREKSAFAYSASVPLSGGRWPCGSMGCRLARVKELAQFAALYSDRVYIHNFLSDYVSHERSVDIKNEEHLQRTFFHDLSLLLYLRPLVEAGKVVLVAPPNYCPHCLVKISVGPNADKRLDRAFNKLIRRYNRELSVSLRAVEGEFKYRYCARGPETLIEHGSTYLGVRGFSEQFKQAPEIVKRLQSGEEVELSRGVLKTLFNQCLAHEVRKNVLFELAISHSLNTRYLTERELDIDLIAKISGDPAIERRNRIVRKYLTSIVPYLENVEPTDLVKLRSKEEEAFILFRNALNKAIDEYKELGESFTAKDAQAIYSDIVEPQLARLDVKVRSARRSLIKDTGSKILVWAGVISVGLFAGFLPSDVAAIATALGLVKIVAEITQRALVNISAAEEIENEEMYFLWKVGKSARKK